jgi:hypothetical protein
MPSLDRGLMRSCVETVGQVYSSRPDLKDQPLESPDHEYLQMEEVLLRKEKGWQAMQ